MFRRLHEATTDMVDIEVDGVRVSARTGETVAAALLAAGYEATRHSPVNGAARAPYCMMGACFECIVEVDGTLNRQGCLVAVRQGMRITTLRGRREAKR